MLEDSSFKLSPRLHEEHRLALPIDSFLNSLGRTQSNKAIGIILSGLGSDGAKGLVTIRAEGGIGMAQDPASATYDSMPQAALASGCVDFVLSPEKIAKELLSLSRHPLVRRPKPKPLEAAPTQTSLLKKIFDHIHRSVGIDFSDYKSSTVKRRLQRRLLLHRLQNLEEYYQLLKDDRDEAQALCDDILICVTSFFRDPPLFEALKQSVFPDLVKKTNLIDPIRVWIPGCASGEEAYSIAISLMEFLGEAASSRDVQIFATDLSEQAIAKARNAVYPESIRDEISSGRLQRFFTKVEGGYQIKKSLRDLCVFASHNLFKDPPFSRMDLISCRNVLIYFDPPLQKKVIPTLHYALSPHGYLVLGPSESLGISTEGFELLDRKNKIYRKIRLPHDEIPPPVLEIPGDTTRSMIARKKLESSASAEVDIARLADEKVLAEIAPPGFLVNKDLRVLQVRGDTRFFSSLAPGMPSFDLPRLLREELRVPVRSLIYK